MALQLQASSSSAVCCVMLVMVVAGGVSGAPPPPPRSYKILMMLPISLNSHANIFMSVAKVLLDRGHQIVTVTNNPRRPNHPNYTEIVNGIPYFNPENINIFETRYSTFGISYLTQRYVNFVQDFYKMKEIKELYKRRKEFDLIIIDQVMNELAYPFIHELPWIGLSPTNLDWRVSGAMGNVFHLMVNVSALHVRYMEMEHQSTLWDRIVNMALSLATAYYYREWELIPAVQKEISILFPDLPPLLELEKNQSVALYNSHFTLDIPRPVLPSQVDIGGINCRPAKPLPQELESWISGAGPAGVVYFSLGTLLIPSKMPPRLLNFLLKAFRRLPQRVLWKYDGKLEGVSDNVLISKWFSQQDILGHDNVKVFLSHGGMLSVQEAICHTTPLLVLPVFYDQIKNGKMVRVSSLGLTLDMETLTEDIVVDSITEIIRNSKYKENIKQFSRVMRDQSTTPQDRVSFWTEYVIRHKGAPHLKSPAAKLSWVEFLMLDVLALLLGLCLVLLYILRHVLRFIWMLFSGPGSKNKTE